MAIHPIASAEVVAGNGVYVNKLVGMPESRYRVPQVIFYVFQRLETRSAILQLINCEERKNTEISNDVRLMRRVSRQPLGPHDFLCVLCVPSGSSAFLE